MASKERSSKRRVGIDAEVTPLQLLWLRGDELPDTFEAHCLKYDTHGTNAALWATHRDMILDEHVKDFPGTRPPLWWNFDAPKSPIGTYPGCHYDGELCEPRKRLGGIGTPTHEVLNWLPSFSYGLPLSFIDHSDVDYYNRHGIFAGVAPSQNKSPFTGVAIDSDDPPLYESEAAFLERHGLFLPGERKRLKKADFEPETLAYVD